MLHMLQWLYTYVAKVCFQCFICVLDVCCKCVLSGCCIRFTHMLQVFIRILRMFYNGFQLFSRRFFASVSEACFMCFICLQTYVPTVAFGYFKSRSVRTRALIHIERAKRSTARGVRTRVLIRPDVRALALPNI